MVQFVNYAVSGISSTSLDPPTTCLPTTFRATIGYFATAFAAFGLSLRARRRARPFCIVSYTRARRFLATNRSLVLMPKGHLSLVTVIREDQ